MRTFTLTGASTLTPTQLRSGLLDEETWRKQDGTVEAMGQDSLTASFPLAGESIPDGLERFVPEGARLKMRVEAAAEAPAGSPQSSLLLITVPGAPVEVRVDLTATADQAQGANLTVHAELTSSVPLFGSMVESALEPVVRSQLRQKLDQLIDLR